MTDTGYANNTREESMLRPEEHKHGEQITAGEDQDITTDQMGQQFSEKDL